MIDLNTLDVHSLPCEDIENKGLLPEIPTIYFAIDSNNLIQYIGRAKNTKQRWLCHHRYNQLSKIGGVRIAYLRIDCIELLPEIESVLIEHFNPPLNNTDVDRGDKKPVSILLPVELYQQLVNDATKEKKKRIQSRGVNNSKSLRE
jgi:hypothetical protein